ncbi:MAG: NADH-quinone oxidoreductase subunit M [Chloroflexi bacterium]|nr:NADH-quinone oxidoreductase subunit M [Chloroflexota bacterium]
MILPWIIIILVIGGTLAWIAGRFGPHWPRWISLATLGIHFGFLLYLWIQNYSIFTLTTRSPWFALFDIPWISQIGISFSLGMDGLSLLLILLINLLGIMAVACSWNAIKDRVGFFHFNLMWILASITGVFLALDLFLFYFFWELMLVPLYFLIGIWGYENRIYATIKFFIFTQVSGLFMLLGILGLYFVHGANTGVYTFSYFQLLGTKLPQPLGFLLMLGMFLAFAVKLPVVPFHTWLPDAHTEAPTAGSVDLAGLVLKVGAYGMIRFLIPLFPKDSLSFAPIAMALGIIGILYGAIVAFGQTDLKRLIAYTSISHMGFVILGIFAWNTIALQGAIIIMIAHGISTSGLFIMVGDLMSRLHTRDFRRMGGLWSTLPRMGGAAMVFTLASLGLPGLGNFVGEFLVLLGVYRVSIPAAALATLGFIVATIYSLWIIQGAFHGRNTEGWKLQDMSSREAAIMTTLIAVILWLGIYPQTVLNTSLPAVEAMQKYAIETQQTIVSPQISPAQPLPIEGSITINTGGKP